MWKMAVFCYLVFSFTPAVANDLPSTSVISGKNHGISLRQAMLKSIRQVDQDNLAKPWSGIGDDHSEGSFAKLSEVQGSDNRLLIAHLKSGREYRTKRHFGKSQRHRNHHYGSDRHRILGKHRFSARHLQRFYNRHYQSLYYWPPGSHRHHFRKRHDHYHDSTCRPGSKHPKCLWRYPSEHRSKFLIRLR